MISVYQVKLDSTLYRSLILDDSIKWTDRKITFDGRLFGSSWTPPRFRVFNPHADTSHIASLGVGAFAVSLPIPPELLTIYEKSGELLSLGEPVEDYAVLNITECSDCIDYHATEWVYAASGRVVKAKELVFNPDLIPEASLFKISTREGYPSYNKSRIFTHSGLCDERDGFQYWINKLKIKGVSFKLVWSDSVKTEEK